MHVYAICTIYFFGQHMLKIKKIKFLYPSFVFNTNFKIQSSNGYLDSKFLFNIIILLYIFTLLVVQILLFWNGAVTY